MGLYPVENTVCRLAKYALRVYNLPVTSRACQSKTHAYSNKNSYPRTPLIQINREGQPSGHAENPDYWLFFENRLHWQFEIRLLLLYLQYVLASKPFDPPI